MIGETVGHYQILRQIGEGPLGTLFCARDVRLGRDVALKALKPEFADAALLDRIRDAVLRQSGLNHPNIASTYDFLRHQDGIYIASEFVDGPNLQSLIDQSPIPPDQAVGLCLEALEALQYAHAAGIVHGDLKPGNLLVGSRMRVKITDFGLARSLGPRNATRILLPAYVSPEQARGQEPDARSDLYSLACILYAMLTGHPPFTGENDFEILDAQVRTPPRSIRESAPRVPRWIDAVALHALAKSPQDRFPSAEEFALVLRGGSEADVGSSARPKSRPADENVAFTVFRPRSLAPEAWETMLVFAHLTERPPDSAPAPEPIEEVRRQARQILGDRAPQFQDLTQDSALPIAREGQLTFVPEIAGIEFNPSSATILWQEQVHRVDFRLRVQAQLEGTTARGRLSVFLGRLVVAQIPLALRVSREAAPGARDHWEPVTQATYRKIFASYSHKDASVVEEFETYAMAMGDRYLRDVIHLRSGEQWRSSLLQMIQQADVFQLFWSTNSMRSPYVEEEWRHALSLRRESFVRPVYWENPLPELPERGLPPEELRALHFQRVSPSFQRQAETRSYTAVGYSGVAPTSGGVSRMESAPPPPPRSRPSINRRKALLLAVLVVLALLIAAWLVRRA